MRLAVVIDAITHYHCRRRYLIFSYFTLLIGEWRAPIVWLLELHSHGQQLIGRIGGLGRGWYDD